MNIAERIKGRFGNNKSGSDLKEDDIPELYHDFMMCYGWIPYEQFRNLTIAQLFIMNEYVQKEKKMRYEQLYVLKGIGKSLGLKIKD